MEVYHWDCRLEGNPQPPNKRKKNLIIISKGSDFAQVTIWYGTDDELEDVSTFNRLLKGQDGTSANTLCIVNDFESYFKLKQRIVSVLPPIT